MEGTGTQLRDGVLTPGGTPHRVLFQFVHKAVDIPVQHAVAHFQRIGDGGDAGFSGEQRGNAGRLPDLVPSLPQQGLHRIYPRPLHRVGIGLAQPVK